MIAFWNYFIYFAVAAVLLWATGAYAAWKDKKIVAYSATILGLAVFFSYILYIPNRSATNSHVFHGL